MVSEYSTLVQFQSGTRNFVLYIIYLSLYTLLCIEHTEHIVYMYSTYIRVGLNLTNPNVLETIKTIVWNNPIKTIVLERSQTGLLKCSMCQINTPNLILSIHWKYVFDVPKLLMHLVYLTLILNSVTIKIRNWNFWYSFNRNELSYLSMLVQSKTSVM